jgi:hypothetical protein
MNLKHSKPNDGGGKEASFVNPWEPSTFNIQRRTFNRRGLSSTWEFIVECSLLNVSARVSGFLLATLIIAGNYSAFAQQTNHPNPRDFSAFQIINDRNIFDPGRRPRVQQSQRSTPRPQQIVDTFSLVGTMSYSNLLLAFFDGSSPDYRKSLGVDGKIATYTLAEIRHDAVKLVSGTNEIELKVGMHMRRSEDGHWSASEAAGGAFNSYVSSSSRGSNRNDRRSYRGGNTGGGAASSQTSSDPNAQSEMPMPPDGGAGPGPDAANLDPNDPVARLMLRRLQEEGGGAAVPQPSNNQLSNNPPAEQPATEPSDTNAAGTPPANDNQNPPPEPPQP